jgi:hypothetical protein
MELSCEHVLTGCRGGIPGQSGRNPDQICWYSGEYGRAGTTRTFAITDDTHLNSANH